MPPVSPRREWPGRCYPTAGPVGDWARGRPRGRRPGPGSGCASRPDWAAQALRGRRVGLKNWGCGRAGWGRGAASAGVAPRRGPGCSAAHLLQADRGVRRGASGDRLLSRPPLYSGSIGGGAAYARCQSPASSSGDGRPGGVGRASGGWNRGSDVRGRNSGSRQRSAGREGGRTDGLAETGGRAGARGQGGGAGGGAAAGAAAAAGGADRAERGRPLPGTPPPGQAGRDSRMHGAVLQAPGRHASADSGRALSFRPPC